MGGGSREVNGRDWIQAVNGAGRGAEKSFSASRGCLVTELRSGTARSCTTRRAEGSRKSDQHLHEADCTVSSGARTSFTVAADRQAWHASSHRLQAAAALFTGTTTWETSRAPPAPAACLAKKASVWEGL